MEIYLLNIEYVAKRSLFAGLFFFFFFFKHVEQVLKLLERESIKWVEDENAGTILIRLDSINRKRLSFVKK